MKLKVVKNVKNLLSVEFEDVSYSLINSLRRSLVRKVNTLAIEDVTFFENNSGIYDEILAHRLGLVLLTTPTDLVNKVDCECKNDKGCSKCCVTLKLNVKGPCSVKGEDLVSNHPKVSVVNKGALITELVNDTQEVNIECRAFLLTSVHHAKHSPGLVSHYFKPVIKINHKNIKNPSEFVNVCPTKVFDVKAGKLNVKDKDACINCRGCVELVKQRDGVEVKGDSSKIVFTFENWGGIKTTRAIEDALTNLDDEVKALMIK